MNFLEYYKQIPAFSNPCDQKLHYHEIRKDDTLNGYGVRTVIFFSGCNHYCKGCHNPQTWDINGGSIFDENAKQKLFTLSSPDYVNGITLSGGDPLMPNNIESVIHLCKEFKSEFPNKTIWCYTGYTVEELNLDALYDASKIDVIVDGPFIPEKADIKYPFAGSTNQRIIDVKKTIMNNEITLFEI